MTNRWSLVIFVIVMFTFNITEFECSKKANATKNWTLFDQPANFMTLVTEYPLGLSDVFDDASNVFRKIVSKMISKKKLVGLDSAWNW